MLWYYARCTKIAMMKTFRNWHKLTMNWSWIFLLYFSSSDWNFDKRPLSSRTCLAAILWFERSWIDKAGSYWRLAQIRSLPLTQLAHTYLHNLHTFFDTNDTIGTIGTHLLIQLAHTWIGTIILALHRILDTQWALRSVIVIPFWPRMV